MLASAIVAYLFGPVLGFAFALIVGLACGWVFAMSAVGRGPELEARALVRMGPIADRVLVRVVDPLRARLRRAPVRPAPAIELGA